MTDQMTDKITLADAYLGQAVQILCLATHSKLGLTTFVESLQARQSLANIRRPATIIDGGIIGFPVSDYLPQEVDVSISPTSAMTTRVILLAHPQDPPRLLERYGSALQGAFGEGLAGGLAVVECFYHRVGDDLDMIISN